MHIKRQNTKVYWPIPRKGSKYVPVAMHEHSNSVPVITVAREALKLVKNRKEFNELIKERKVFINGKEIKESNFPVMLFDILSFPSVNKNYRASLKDKKMIFEEVHGDKVNNRIHKIISKKLLKGKKIQINLSNGKNVLSSEKMKVGDFVYLDSKNKIKKIISLEKGSEVLIMKGKNKGLRGKIKEIKTEEMEKIVEVSTEKGILEINLENVFLID